nr:uncharacterized protein LOC764941 [Haemonchus contortus]
MAICTFNARTLASEACIEDLMMQARKIKYDVIGLTETRRHRPLHAVFETGEELFLLRFADDIVLITPNVEQAEQMLAEFDNACGKIGLRLNITKTMFMRNGLVPDAPFMLNGTNIPE